MPSRVSFCAVRRERDRRTPRMEDGENHKTQKILQLTLEIIYLLTGEDYIIIKKTLETNMAPNCLALVPGRWNRSQGLIVEPPSQCLALERDNDKKILEATQRIIGLLTGEAQSHGEEHGDRKKDFVMESWKAPKSPDSLGRVAHPNAPSLDLLKDLRTIYPTVPKSCSTEELDTAHFSEKNAPCRPVDFSKAVDCVQTTSPNLKGKMAIPVEDTDLDCGCQTSLGVKELALCNEEGPALPTHRSTSGHIKEEASSSDEEDLSNGEAISVIVKEEPDSGDEEHLPTKEQSQTWTGKSGLADHSKCYICNQDLSPQEVFYIAGELYPYTTCGTCFTDNAQVMMQRTTHVVDKCYSCSECGKSFANNSHLVRHQRVHSGDKPYSCPDCGRSFTNSSHLVRHQRVHTGDKPYSCLQCGRCFSNNSHLVIHQRVHTGDKPYSCDECGKSFGTKQNMDRHKRIHTGEKPFACAICKRSFAHKSAMIKHERIHTGERPYTCGECGKGFVAKSELVKHERTHTGEKPYECTECGKRFSRNYELGLHKKIHTGEKPHCCPQCGKWFLRKYEFILHERTHTGETPYCCSICGKGFSHRTNFSRHLSTHTSYNP